MRFISRLMAHTDKWPVHNPSFRILLHLLESYIYIQNVSWAQTMVNDSLRAGRSGNRIPVGAIFFAPVQTGPGNHPTFYKMGTGSFPVVKRPGLGVDHPPSSPRLKKEKTISLLPLCVFMSSYKVTFTPYDATKACTFVTTYQIDGNLRLHHQLRHQESISCDIKLLLSYPLARNRKRNWNPATSNNTHTSVCAIRYPTYSQRTNDFSSWKSGRKSKRRK